jgi:hypothetical protein
VNIITATGDLYQARRLTKVISGAGPDLTRVTESLPSCHAGGSRKDSGQAEVMVIGLTPRTRRSLRLAAFLTILISCLRQAIVKIFFSISRKGLKSFCGGQAIP